MSRRVIPAIAIPCLLAVAFGFSHAALAGWIDVKTGKPVNSWPVLRNDPNDLEKGVRHVRPNIGDPKHAYDSETGRNFALNDCGDWIDTKTGKSVNSWPVLRNDPNDLEKGVRHIRPNIGDPKRAYDSETGRNFAREECPSRTVVAPTTPRTGMAPSIRIDGSTGLYLGGELVKNWGWVRSTERLAATDVITNQFTDSADPVGGGFLIGYRFAPFAYNIVVSPFASFDFMSAPVNHTFAGGSFLGTTANFMGTFGVKVGPQFGALWFYGIGGVSVLNQTLNINFIPVASSQSATVPGGTAGIGGAWRPSFLQGFGLPVSVFAEYQHFWWADANFNRPVASPLFNYTFRRQDDLVKIGFTVDLNPPPPPVTPSGPRYVKALPAK